MSPPPTLKENSTKLNFLATNFDVDAIKRLMNQTLVTLRIFLMDKANSAGLWPEDFDMLGDPISVRVNVGDLEVADLEVGHPIPGYPKTWERKGGVFQMKVLPFSYQLDKQ